MLLYRKWNIFVFVALTFLDLYEPQAQEPGGAIVGLHQQYYGNNHYYGQYANPGYYRGKTKDILKYILITYNINTK